MVIIGQSVHAQSIYSFQGIGSLNHQGMPNNEAMGELGIGTPSIWHVNTQNPAHLVRNSFSTFQLGVQGEGRNFAGENISGSDFDGSLRFLAYAFPIKPGIWSSSFGILPYSSVNYNTFNEGTVEGDTTVTKFINDSGEGGLTNLFWSNGVAIHSKIYLGIRVNYTFGSIDKESQVSISGDDIPLNTINFTDRTSYSDINFQFGVAYRHPLSEKKTLNLGLVYSFQNTLNGKNTLELIRLAASGQPLETQEVSNTDQDFKLPQTIGFGFSYQKPNTYIFGVDFELQAWKNAGVSINSPSAEENENADMEVDGDTNTFGNQTKISVGGEWIPEFGSVSSYFKRATYRMGFNYLRIPYVVNGQSINDFSINFGTSLPVSGLSSLDLAFRFGQLGTTNNGLIRESYYRIVIGATINDRWFVKRKYN